MRRKISNFKKSNFDWTRQEVKVRTRVIKSRHAENKNNFLRYIRSLLF